MSILRVNFGRLVDEAMSQPGRAGIRPVIEKELLHYDILFALDRRGFLKDLVFQGGTCLRLCYGSHRFSEDLDFATSANFDFTKLEEMAKELKSYLGDRYGLEVDVKPPKGKTPEQLQGNILIDKWQVSVTTSPERRDMPRQKIKIEVATVPAHEPQLTQLKRNYDFLPSGYEDLLIRAETPTEILADKLVAFPVTLASHVRHRDIWDIQWLRQTQGAKIRPDLVARKIDDYGVTDYGDKLTETLERLDEVILGADFRAEMTRFLPQDRVDATFNKDGFLPFLSSELRQAFTDLGTKMNLLDKPSTPSFEM